MKRSSRSQFDRRQVLVAGGALAAIAAALPGRVAADLPAMQQRMRSILGERTAEEGRITLDLPEIAENGNTVPLTVEVDSPMAADDYVKAVHVMTERNPDPEVATFHFTPRSGRAAVSTRIRLAESQTVHAVAEMSDGSVYTASRSIDVTIGGCGG
ncbi:MAG TPA: thiosulfate oxidation carrier protein SoxY [Methyloceanibacter sp.]|nr:thiosulfate oxidation carrier protein SoxY [Methyloceanibacter sp.]